MSNTLRTLHIRGDSHAMGLAHGEEFAAEIRSFAEQRMQLCLALPTDGPTLTRDVVLADVAACVPYHERYAPEAMAEMRGIAHASGLSIEEVIILSGFTDIVDLLGAQHALSQAAASAPVDDCTAFVVSPQASEGPGPYIGQTWDMNREASPYVLMLRAEPHDGPNYLTMTVTGCVAMIGMNDAGIAVGINNLSATNGTPGVNWTVVVRRALSQEKIEEAIATIVEAPLAGGHNFYLADSHGRCVNIEAMPGKHFLEEIRTGAFVHTNHCLSPHTRSVESLPDAYSASSTHHRHQRATELLSRDLISVSDLVALTRDHSANPGVCVHVGPGNVNNIESSAAIIMSPVTGELWAVKGNPCLGEYEHLVL
ncbi:MAG: hypothetical protein IPM16_10950 [Chloroflexi bacterium]|nr:hypothetical protein [Chloroflexota bacterium]